MTAAEHSGGRSAKLLIVDAAGAMRHWPRASLGTLFDPGDLVVANDAATLPASLTGADRASDEAIEVRLGAWVSLRDPTRFDAIAFGAGDHRTPTERRSPPPALAAGSRLALGPLEAIVERRLDPAGLFRLRFLGDRASILARIARHGAPIQYAHVPEPLALWDVWTTIAADPVAFEPPSAGFALDWRTIAMWRRRGVEFATLTHAAGLSSTGSPALDARLPLDEPFFIPARTAEAVRRAKRRNARVVAIGTTVVRALESAAAADGGFSAGDGIARGRISRLTPLRVADAILTGVHQPGESHFDLIRAFASSAVLERMSAAFAAHRYRTHEFGDSVLIEGEVRKSRNCAEGGGTP